MLEYLRGGVMNRHKNRENGVICIYQYLVCKRDIEELIEDNFDPEGRSDEYIMSVIRTSCDNIERYSGYIDRVLDDWSFERLGMIEKAILLNGCAEFDLKQIEMNVIIDEYVRIARKYCDSDSYKLINGVLDRI